MFRHISHVCQSLTACTQLTSQQCNEMIAREWNLGPSLFFKIQLCCAQKSDVKLFSNGHTTFSTSLDTVLETVPHVATLIAQSWSTVKKTDVFQRLFGIRFEYANKQPCNAWIFRHDSTTGFFIVPMLLAVQPAMIIVDLIVPIGPALVECCGEPLAIQFFPKVVAHNALQQLLDVNLESLPEIIGVNCSAQRNTLAQKLLHPPTWDNAVRLSIVAAQQLTDARVVTAPLLTPASNPAQLLKVDELVESAAEDFECSSRTHPELFHFIRHGELANDTRAHINTAFTPNDIYDRVNEVVAPLQRSSLLTHMMTDAPIMNNYAINVMNNYFLTLDQTLPSSGSPSLVAADLFSAPVGL